MVKQNKPLLICMTATRNYAWVTETFLAVNSLWADYIIIADQCSTDGTREMINKYPKAILVENTDLTYSESKRSQLVIDRARQIEGDKILMFLAIDEILSANFESLPIWNKILNSKQGDLFFFEWANVLPGGNSYFSTKTVDGTPFYMARMFHDDNITPYNSEGLDMHTHCIPYPSDDSGKVNIVEDIKIIHFAEYYPQWNEAKQIYYQFVDYNINQRSTVTLDRMYALKTKQFHDEKAIPFEWIDYSRFNVDPFLLIDTTRPLMFMKYIDGFIEEKGFSHYQKLNVWSYPLMSHYTQKYKLPLKYKLAHMYLNFTRNNSNFLFVRGLDKVLKQIV